MSYPALILPAGYGWTYKKTAAFVTTVQRPQFGKDPISATGQVTPTFNLEITWNYLKENGVTMANDFQYLHDFFIAMRASFGRFTFDPGQFSYERLIVSSDITKLSSGFSGRTGGLSNSYQLFRSTMAALQPNGDPTFAEAVQYLTALNGVYLDGNLQAPSSYSPLSFPATINFHTAPAPGQVLSWDGAYGYLCKFADDAAEFEEFMFQLWEMKSMKIETVVRTFQTS